MRGTLTSFQLSYTHVSTLYLVSQSLTYPVLSLCLTDPFLVPAATMLFPMIGMADSPPGSKNNRDGNTGEQENKNVFSTSTIPACH